MSRITRLVLAAVAAVAALALVLAFVPPASADTARLKVIQHNTDHVSGVFGKVLKTIPAYKPTLVFIQEVCGHQWADLHAKKKSQWAMSYHPRMGVDTDGDGDAANHGPCLSMSGGTDGRIGELAIYTGGPKRGSVSAYRRDYKVPAGVAEDANMDFGTACVKFPWKGITMRGCSVHLTAFGGRALRKSQTAELKRITSPWIRQGNSVVLGGDFNAKPGKAEMDRIYDRGGNGRFNEADQLSCNCRGGGPTTDPGKNGKRRKIDYVFYSANRTPASFGGNITTQDTNAGHELLKAWAQVRH